MVSTTAGTSVADPVAQTQEGPEVEGLTSNEVAEAQRYLVDSGLPVEEVESFAGFLGVEVPELYRFTSTELEQTNGDEFKAPVEVVDGKIRYNTTMVDKVPAIRSKTEIQLGDRGTGDSCSFPQIEADTTLGQHVLSEVTELDPENCSRVIESVAYDPESLEVPSFGATIRGDSFIPGFSCKDGGIDTDQPTFFQPERQLLPGEHRSYYKQAFVDPICISITSSTLNVSWKNQLNSSNGVTLIDRENRNDYFTQLGEVWVNKATTLNPTTEPLNRANSIYASLDHSRTETDFPDHVVAAVAAFGSAIPGVGIIGSLAAVWAACGFDLGNTHFTSWQQIGMHRNGGRTANGSGGVNGGCSNLVHEQVWHGTGTYAR